MSTNQSCSCTPDCDGSAADTADPATGGCPFARVRFNDGMLLGAADLRVEQNGHLWRQRLHQALLHGAGTVWGLAVRRSTNRRQLQVEPGLAVDARGRNLYITNTLCLDVSALGEATLATFPAAGEGRRRAWVVISYEPCAKEPVSALRPTCAEAPSTPAWSREVDSIRVDLVGEEPEEPIATLRRLLERTGAAPDRGPGRWLGGATNSTDLRALLLEIALGPTLPGDRDRRLLAELWEGDDALPLVLAEVELGSDGTIITVTAEPRNDVRALLPGTQLMAELLFGVPLAGAVRGGPTSVVLERVQVVGGLVDLRFNVALEPASATAASVGMLTWDGVAWSSVGLTVSVLDRSLTLTPTGGIPAGQPVQVLLRGVGPDALLGAGGLPFAGETGASPLPIARDLALVATWS